MDKRQQKGYQIAQQKGVKETKDGWLVKSQTTNAFYRVSDMFICDCPDSEIHNETCKHAYAVRYYLDIEKQKPTGVETERVKLTYKQAWSVYNAAQSSEGVLFDELLHDLVKEVQDPRPPQLRGHPRLPLSEETYITIKKVYSQMSSRRAKSLFGIAQGKGHIGLNPHFNTVTKFLNREDITPILHKLIAITAAPLRAVEENFAIDSSGFRTHSFGAYAEEKYGLNREHKWLKAHICVGTKTNIITAVKITEEYGADSPQFIPLAKETAENGFSIKEMSADKAYSSRYNLDYINQLGGTAFIPFKRNSTLNRAGGSYLWKKMLLYFELNNEEFMQHYHKRSNVESVFAAIKKKLGETLKSKNHTSQVNELLCKLIAYNITVLIQEMHELGIEPKFTLR